MEIIEQTIRSFPANEQGEKLANRFIIDAKRQGIYINHTVGTAYINVETKIVYRIEV